MMQAQKPFRPTFRFAAALTLNLAVVVLEIISAVMSVSRNGLSLFQFYTEDSNLFTLAACAIFSVCLLRFAVTGKAVPEWARLLKYMASCCLALTFIVVVCVLAPMAGGAEGFKMMLLYDSMLYHHLLCPILTVASFYVENETMLPRKAVRTALAPTIVYAAVVIILNIAKVIEGPYPFLYVYKQPVYMSVLWCVIILGGAYLIALLLWLTGKKFVKAKPREPDNG